MLGRVSVTLCLSSVMSSLERRAHKLLSRKLVAITHSSVSRWTSEGSPHVGHPQNHVIRAH